MRTSLVVSASVFALVAGATTGVAAQSKPDASSTVDTVVVTAQKRTERLQDVPVPVTALSAKKLVASNQVRLQDYFATVPGLNFAMDQHGAPNLSIRGVTTGGATNPTVGITIDDVPYGASTALAGGATAPDIDPSDLARIEVLRGPQGTLYGASSIGGLLKYVTLDPSTSRMSGSLSAGFESVDHGAQLGYSVRGGVNMPLNDTMAVRISAFSRLDPGYIDDPYLGERGVNRVNAEGGLFSFLWKPTDTLSVKLGALLQDSQAGGSPYVDVEPGFTSDLQQIAPPRVGVFSRGTRAYSAVIKAKFGDVDVTSVTGYSVNKISDTYDFTNAIGGFTAGFYPQTIMPASAGFEAGQGAVIIQEMNKTDKFTEEFRLSGTILSRVDWLAGFFYANENSPFQQYLSGVDATTQALIPEFQAPWSNTYVEYAGFADLTFHITSKFDVQLGGRESENTQTYSEVDSGPLVYAFEGFPSPNVFPKVTTREHAFTYLVTPQYSFSPNLMVYARFASGFRPGGPNPTASVYGLPTSFGPDTTKNYEIGAKGNTMDGRLTFDASLYYIDWKNIQLYLLGPSGFNYYANATAAKSEGVELSFELRPIHGLTLSGWGAYSDAELTQAMPSDSAAVGAAGASLPFDAKFTGNLAVEEVVPLPDNWTGSVGGNVNYVGAREGIFVGTAQRQDYPAYTQFNLHLGVTNDGFSVNAYVNNLSDVRGQLGGGLGSSISNYAFNYIQPRTFGLTFTKTF